MKLTKRQIKRIIMEERENLLRESRSQMDESDSDRFADIMEQIAELVYEAYELAGRPEEARGYWFNGILGRIDPGEHGIGFSGVSMVDTLRDYGQLKNEEMMEAGYNDGYNGDPPEYPDNKYYMTNYTDGQRDAE